MSSYFSNIHISDTQISHIIHSSSSYIYINTSVSCKRYPPSLPYIIIVQTCGKRWDLPKFVNVLSVNLGFSQSLIYIHIYIYIVELRTPATPVGVGGGKERGGCQLNLRTWHAEGRRPILGLCWPSLGLCWPILRLCWPMPMRTKCCNLQHFALWDGKNPCKYHSFSPRKWLKHSYLQSFVHIAIFDFLKNV